MLFLYICTFGKTPDLMTRRSIQNIIFIGAGNMAVNLALAVAGKGFKIIQVYNRSETAGRNLSKKVGATYTNDLKKLSQTADLYIVAVSDDSLEQIVEQVSVGDKMIVHTSGPMSMHMLKNASENFGVLYFPQTFSKEHPVSLSGVPACIEANREENEILLKAFARKLTRNIRLVDSSQRKMIHLAAIFANNFTNFMYVIAEDLLKNEKLDFGLLQPLIRKTAANARHKNLFQFQTGPAVREDTEIMKDHLRQLKNHPEYKQVYELISKMIIHHKKQKNGL